jgi:hypothetical protein
MRRLTAFQLWHSHIWRESRSIAKLSSLVEYFRLRGPASFLEHERPVCRGGRTGRRADAPIPEIVVEQKFGCVPGDGRFLRGRVDRNF